MKKIIAVFVIICLFYSCQKDPGITDTEPKPPSTNCRLIRMVQGTDNDTVFLFSYNNKGQIVSINDSTNNDLSKVFYNAEGKKTKFSDGVYFDFSIEYNTDGLPYKIVNVRPAGGVPFTGVQYTYEYNAAKQPVKRTENSFGNGKWMPWQVRKYEFSGGDISRISSYGIGIGYDSTQITITDYAYYTDLNAFHSLCYFGSPYSPFGLFDMLDVDFYFNKHLFKSSSENNGTTGYSLFQQYVTDSTTNTFTGQTSMRIAHGLLESKHTRHFFYDCK